uniref:Uncharacterized protein n=1 Tax=Anguilla anguilla TaxID=7936 RepID=A0A0E9PZS5_ANGAN
MTCCTKSIPSVGARRVLKHRKTHKTADSDVGTLYQEVSSRLNLSKQSLGEAGLKVDIHGAVRRLNLNKLGGIMGKKVCETWYI